MTRRILFAFLLALILPFTQAAAAAHEVSHAKSAPAAIHCDHCTAAASIGAGIAAAEAPAVVAVAGEAAEPGRAAAPHAAQATLSFRSRAPPSQP